MNSKAVLLEDTFEPTVMDVARERLLRGREPIASDVFLCAESDWEEHESGGTGEHWTMRAAREQHAELEELATEGEGEDWHDGWQPIRLREDASLAARRASEWR